FFILAGNLMAAGGISQRLVKLANTLVGRMTGGLAIVSVLAGMFFAAISGSGAATTAALGSILIPSMVNKGYNKEFATTIQATSGAIGIIIPPSVPLVLYGIGGGVSIGDLFLGGFGPGILIGISLMTVAYFISKKEGYGNEKPATLSEIGAAFKDAYLALLMPIIILGGIYSGVFTPTEAAVVAVVYGFVVGTLIYKELNWKNLNEILTASVITTAIIMFIIGSAALFGLVLTRERIPQEIATWLLSISNSPWVILMMINVFLLIIGTFMETAAAIIILTPILVPIILAAGIDPVHFGIIMITNLGIGLVTPPIGINLYVASNIAGAKMEMVIKRTVPFLIAMIISLVLITYVPQISLWPIEFINNFIK
ncbi:MAG: TRAP transporter large permease, partial [Bacillota bacterium]|nr:TRAP transporter large permease [Bacillota bacterium]